MPFPLIGGIAGGLGFGAVSAFSAPFFGLITHELDAKLLPEKYKANWDTRTLLPGPDAMYQAYLAGKVTIQELGKGLGHHNINISQQNVAEHLDWCGSWWRSVLSAQIPKIDLNTLMHSHISGYIEKDQFDQFKKMYGFRNDQMSLLWSLLYGKMDLNIILNQWYRGQWDKEQTIMRLRRFYGINDKHANNILDGSRFIPPPSDLTMFAVKDVFNPDMITKLKLLDELDEQKEMRQWFNAQGIGKVGVYDKEGQYYERDIVEDYWVAHWRNMSPTQGYEALHRLRENRVKRWDKTIPGLKPFAFSDLKDLLKRDDYVPGHRDWLAAISYSVPRLIDIKNMYYKDIIDTKEVTEKLLDRGYNESDADEVTKYWITAKKEVKDKEREKKLNKGYTRFRTAIINAYKQGSIGRDSAASGLLSTEMESENVYLLLNAIDIEVNLAKVKEYINMVRKEFYLGLYDGIEAFTELTQGGVDPVRANQLVQIWQRKLARPQRVASTEKLLQWYSTGFIDQNNLLLRLQKLGWTNSDVVLYMADAQRLLSANQARILAQQARDDKSRAAAARQLVVQARSDRLAAVQDFYRHSSPSDMKEWYRKGLLSSDDIYDRLTTYMAWTNDDATRFVLSLTGGHESNGQESQN